MADVQMTKLRTFEIEEEKKKEDYKQIFPGDRGRLPF